MYRIKHEYIDLFGHDATSETVLTKEDIQAFAEETESSIESIMEMVYPDTEAEAYWYNEIAKKENRYHY